MNRQDTDTSQTRRIVAVTKAENNILHVVCPRHPAFSQFARNHRARRNRSLRAWEFPAKSRSAIADRLVDLYGTDGSPGPTCDVRIQAAANLEATRRGIFALGREVALAFGRDTGAIPGPSTVLVEGNIYSNGSRTYWTTQIRKGTVLEVRDVPEALARKFVRENRSGQNPDWTNCVILEEDASTT